MALQNIVQHKAFLGTERDRGGVLFQKTILTTNGNDHTSTQCSKNDLNC
jgi:hypothetical protein